jgi:LCP family protein required for cell wall assembly
MAAMVGMLVGAAVNAYFAHQSSQVEPLVQRQPLAELQPVVRQANGFRDPLHVLFLASDVVWEGRRGAVRQGLRGNTDTMMLLRLDPARRDVRIISIPRDTRVPIPGRGTFKINAANPYGGPVLAAQAVADLLDVQIDRYVLVNTQAVTRLVDALGGISLELPRDYRYDDFAGKLHIRLAKGFQHLDGRQAHDFLRFRHDGQGDIGRIQRQQMFLQAAWAQWLTPNNLLAFPELVGLMRDHLETDLSLSELVRLAAWGRELDQRKVRMVMVPGREALIGGGWFWQPDEIATRRLVKAFLVDGVSAPLAAPQDLRVALRDGVGDRRAVNRLKEALQQAGYARVQYLGRETMLGQRHTRVIAQNGDEGSADTLARAIAARDVRIAAVGVLGYDVTVIMGKDWLHQMD